MSKAFRLGLFVIFSLLIAAAGVFWIGSKQFLFNPTYSLYADFPNVAGLSEGSEVRVGGMHEGTVKHIDLPHRTDQKIRVLMQMKSVTRDVVRKDSLAAIRSEGLVGDKYVEVSFGSNEGAKVNNGDTIAAEPPLEISDLIKKTDAILDSTKGVVKNIDAASGNLQSVTSKINNGTGTVGALINDKSLYQRVNQGANSFQEDMEALKHNFLLRGFFNKRGYENTADLTKNAIAQLPSTPAAKQFDFDAGKIFDKPDTAKLKKPKTLNPAGEYLQSNPFGLAVVAAYTDMKGDSQKDHVLTEARAAAVRDYLVQNFKLQDQRIKTIGLGKESDARNESGVEILVYPQK